MNTANYKKLSLIFISCVIALLVLSAAAVYIFDPYQIFHQSYFRKGYAYSKTFFQDAGLINNYAFDSIIIGTSMLENTPAHEASERLGGHFANLSINDSDFYERAIILRRALRQKDIKQVIYSLEEHIYTFPRFGSPKHPKSSYDFLYDENRFNDYKIYLNRDFIRMLFKPAENSVDLPSPWSTNELAMRRLGGLENWVKYPAPSWEKDFLSVHLPHAAEQSLQKKPSPLTPVAVNERIKSYLKNFVFMIIRRHKQTHFHLIFPPYYRYVHAEKRQNELPKYLRHQAIIRFIVKHAAKLPNVTVYGFDELPFTADIANYADLTHYSPEINLFILDAIKEKKYIINKDNVEDYLKKTAQLAYDFDIVKLNNEVRRLSADSASRSEAE